VIGTIILMVFFLFQEKDNMNTSKLLSFEKLHNIRDLGGMTAGDGGRIVDGKLIRSGNLSDLSEQDRTAFISLAEDVVDFRTDTERNEKPDVQMQGIRYHHIPIMESLTAGITREKAADQDVFENLGSKPAEARQYMCDMYHTFAESDFAVAQYSRFIRLLLERREKAVVWHCTAGKDRVGIGTAIIEEILGVARDDVIDDYLATNEYLKADHEALTEFVKSQATEGCLITEEALRYLFGADRDYIEEYYHTIDSKYGSFSSFLRDGLKLTQNDIHELQSRYLI